MNVLHNRCDCINRVHEFINNIVPELLNSLAEGFKLTNSYQLYVKDKERLQAIIDSRKDLGQIRRRAYVWSDQYDIILEVTDSYPAQSQPCEYYRKTVYLWKNKGNPSNDRACNFMPLSLYTHKEMVDASQEAREIETQVSALKNRLSLLKRLIGK
jgi:hypothetical protein